MKQMQLAEPDDGCAVITVCRPQSPRDKIARGHQYGVVLSASSEVPFQCGSHKVWVSQAVEAVNPLEAIEIASENVEPDDEDENDDDFNDHHSSKTKDLII
jgi:hypothetical protein